MVGFGKFKFRTRRSRRDGHEIVTECLYLFSATWPWYLGVLIDKTVKIGCLELISVVLRS